MILLCIAILIVLAIILGRLGVDLCDEGGALIVIICLLILSELFILANIGYTNKTINDKLKIYAEENQEIESSIASIVKEYCEYESKTFKDVTNEDCITLVQMYPELKTSDLVNKQLDVYVSNNNKIKSLKCKKANLKGLKWIAYFGG